MRILRKFEGRKTYQNMVFIVLVANVILLGISTISMGRKWRKREKKVKLCIILFMIEVLNNRNVSQFSLNSLLARLG